MGTTSIEDLAAAAPDGRRWFQLYLWRDREASRDFVARAEAAGYEALVLTVDTPVAGPRLRDVRNGLTIPPSLSLKTFAEGALHPAWWFDLLTTEPLEFASLNRFDGTVAELVGRLFDPTATIADLAWLRSIWDGPLVVKGILDAADARAVVDAGADAVVVSNHGGRQLDRAATPLEALPSVVDAVGDRAEVYVDGGVMSGSDIVAAVALGARAALVGRAYLYGLMAGGERGVERAADILVREVASTLALLGVTRVSDLRADHVRIRLAAAVVSSMDVIEYTPTRDQYAYTFGGVASAMRIRPGTALRLWSDDAFNGALRSVDDLSSAKVDLRFVNPQTGPFYVEGAEPGDTLVLHFVALEPARDWGASAAIPFFGGMTSTDRVVTLQEPLPDTTWIYELDRDRGTVGFAARHSDHRIELPIEPMLGTVGVAPAGGEVRSSLVPDRFGGNMDTPQMRAGSTVFLGVNVEGAMFSIGDGHYRQGEGEACGTAVEGAMTTTLIVELIKGGAPGWPRIEDDTHWMTVGSSRPMEDSWRIANAELVHWVGQLQGLHTMDAYQLCSQIAEVPVANVVDANYSVVVKAAKALLPAADAFGGMHADLRARARSLSNDLRSPATQRTHSSSTQRKASPWIFSSPANEFW